MRKLVIVTLLIGLIGLVPFTVNAPGTIMSLADDFTTAATVATTLTVGGVSLVGHTLNTGTFTAATSQTVNYGTGGTINCATTSTTTAFSSGAATTHSGTGTVKLPGVGAGG